MGTKNKTNMAAAVVVLATIFSLAAILIVSISFDGPGFGKLWPVIPLALFGSLALVSFADKYHNVNAPWAMMAASFFLFWLLSKTQVMPFRKSWPFLVLILGVLIAIAVLMMKNRDKGPKGDK
ncbi:hypothetical protein KKF84_00895 [Myxococcota bacterium]|nr:hypothetical protein [Myxococcota bacterium]